MKVFTMGFTQKNAEQFFTRLQVPGVKRVLDVRLNNVSQLAGFTKRDDLRYFLSAILGMDDLHLPELAPTKDIMDAFKKEGGGWAAYERQFLSLLRERKVEETVPKNLIDGACLLCSEPGPDRCHRRLVAEYLQKAWGGLEIEHL